MGISRQPKYEYEYHQVSGDRSFFQKPYISKFVISSLNTEVLSDEKKDFRRNVHVPEVFKNSFVLAFQNFAF